MVWANEADAFATTVEAMLHKDPTTRILCLQQALVPSILAVCPSVVMTVSSLFQFARNTTTAQHTGSEALEFTPLEALLPNSERPGEKFGLVIGGPIDQIDTKLLDCIRGLVSSTGHLLFSICTNNSSTESWQSALRDACFSGIELISTDGTVLTSAVESVPNSEDVYHSHTGDVKTLLLVYRDTPTSLLSVASAEFSNKGWHVRCQSITSLDLRPKERVILLADMEGPFLAQLNEAQLKGLIHLTQTASAITWVTCGGLLSGDVPEFAMTEGAARVIRNEIASLDLVTLDFDIETTSESRVAELLFDILTRQQASGQNGETEYYLKGNVVYINRLVSSEGINRQFVPDSGFTTTLSRKDHPAIRGRVHDRNIVFHQDYDKGGESMGPDEVEVQVAAIGITASDGSDDATYLNHQISGTVTRVGSEVVSLVPPANVFGFALNHLATFQRTSASLLQPLPHGCSLSEAASLPCPFATAMYGLEDLARIEPGENVVFVDCMGDVGLAVIQICRLHQANLIVVTSSPASKDLLLARGGLSNDQVIHYDPSSISADIKTATAGKGIDVALYPVGTRDEICIDFGHSMAPFGRVITFGSDQRWDSGKHYALADKKGISFFCFDLADLIQMRPQVVARLLGRCADLYSQGKIGGSDRIHVRGPGEYYNIVRSATKDLGSGSHVLAYDEETLFNVVPTKRQLKFRPDATYLLIGGLGGIGRKVAVWMTDRGARHLAFVSRTGTDNPAAHQAVEELISRGVAVSVLRGDITRREELATAISRIDPAYPIRGVLNAAGKIGDCMFTNMTFDVWHSVTQSKLVGCRNLHELLKDQELDFFVMTSSISAQLGSTGQSNYCASNAYLDSLARHRRMRGFPAVSLNLPAIFGFGYIHDHSLERNMGMKGMYGTKEKEMLDAFEVAMTPQCELPSEVDHIVMGLQPRRFGLSMKEAGSHVRTPRLSWLAMTMEEQAKDVGDGMPSYTASEDIVAKIRHAQSMEKAVEAVTTYMARRLARTMMIEEDQVQTTQKSVSNHGLDSMIGAEFRSWIFREFGVDIPFQQLLSGTLTLHKLAEILCEKVGKGE
ncbi:KR domain-containing protein [Hypoxylon sp. NC1633]|nr:KR domain-containing protein [Hypoxylon sp. NC1633]